MTNDEIKLNYKRTMLIGLVFMSIQAFWTFYDQQIPILLESVFGLRTTPANFIMAIDNILALFMLPLFGTLSDKCRSRWGRRTPFIVFGTAGAVLGFWGMALFLGLRHEFYSFWPFFACLFLTLVALSVYRSPAVALMPDLTPRRHRSKANAIINLMGVVGGGVALLSVMLTVKSEKYLRDGVEVISYDATDFWPVFLVVGLFMVLGIALFLLFVPEEKTRRALLASGEIAEDDDTPAEAQKGSGDKLPKPVLKSLIFLLLAVAAWYIAYNGISTNLSRYCERIMGKDSAASSAYMVVTLVVSTIAFLPLGILSAKWGRKKMILAGITLMGVAVACASFLSRSTPDIFIYIIFACVGIGWAGINVNSYPMVVEMSKNGDIGRYTGYYYTFSMAAQVVTPLVTALLIDHTSLGFGVLFPYATLFMALAFVCMIFVRHGDAKPQAKASLLENFDTPDD